MNCSADVITELLLIFLNVSITRWSHKRKSLFTGSTRTCHQEGGDCHDTADLLSDGSPNVAKTLTTGTSRVKGMQGRFAYL